MAWAATGVVRVLSVEMTTVADLPLRDDLAQIEKLESGAVLQALIRRFYPDATDDDQLAVLNFEVEERPSNEPGETVQRV
jgi:hypothetical protein